MENRRLRKLARRLKSEPQTASPSQGTTVTQDPLKSLIDTVRFGSSFTFAPEPAMMVFRRQFPGFQFCAIHEATAGISFLRLAGAPPEAGSAGPTGGFSIQVSDEFERAVSGNQLVLKVVARAEPGAGSTRFAVAYSTNEVGNSGWRWLDVGPEWSTYEVRYGVAEMVNGNGDFIGLLPDAPGAPAVDVLLIACFVQAKEPEQSGFHRPATAAKLHDSHLPDRSKPSATNG